MEIFNEMFVCVSGYFLMIFSQWIYDPVAFYNNEENCHAPVTKYNYGYAYIGCVVLVLSLNISFVVYEQCKSGKKAYQKRIHAKAWGVYYTELEIKKAEH